LHITLELSSDLVHTRGRQQGYDLHLPCGDVCLLEKKWFQNWEGMHVVRGMHACFVDLSTSSLAAQKDVVKQDELSRDGMRSSRRLGEVCKISASQKRHYQIDEKCQKSADLVKCLLFISSIIFRILMRQTLPSSNLGSLII
jgi:hypothetical protein